MPALTRLELASNELSSLPANMSFFRTLQELNLSSNNFSSDSVIVDPNTLMGSLGTIPGLQKLNLSRNKFKKFHSDTLPQDNAALPEQERAFASLAELNLSFNALDEEDALTYPATQIPTLAVLVVTGNPFSVTGQQENYEGLEQLLNKRGAILVNETLNMPTFLRRGQRGRPPLALPAPTDINNMPKARDGGPPALEHFEDMDSGKARFAQVDGARPPAQDGADEGNFFLTENVVDGQGRTNQDLHIEEAVAREQSRIPTQDERQETAEL